MKNNGIIATIKNLDWDSYFTKYIWLAIAASLTIIVVSVWYFLPAYSTGIIMAILTNLLASSYIVVSIDQYIKRRKTQQTKELLTPLRAQLNLSHKLLEIYNIAYIKNPNLKFENNEKVELINALTQAADSIFSLKSTLLNYILITDEDFPKIITTIQEVENALREVLAYLHTDLEDTIPESIRSQFAKCFKEMENLQI